MKLPRLVAPTGVESVAIPTTHTVAVRIPATITGSARGTRTFARTWASVIPRPRPARTRLGSTSSRPVIAFRRTGSML